MERILELGRRAAKLGILGFVHNPQPAVAEFFENSIVRNGLADHMGKSMRDPPPTHKALTFAQKGSFAAARPTARRANATPVVAQNARGKKKGHLLRARKATRSEQTEGV